MGSQGEAAPTAPPVEMLQFSESLRNNTGVYSLSLVLCTHTVERENMQHNLGAFIWGEG